MYTKNFHASIKIWRTCQRTKYNNDAQNTSTYLKGVIQITVNLGVSAHVRKKLPRLYKDLPICANNSALEDFYSKNTIRNFCACMQKTSTSLLRICVYAQIIQRWKSLLSNITIRNFCACTQYLPRFYLRFAYMHKNPINDYHTKLK